MATLQSTTVPDNGYYRVGTSTNTAYVSSGGIYAHLGQNAWYSSTLGWQGGGPFIQLLNSALFFYTTSTAFDLTFYVSGASTLIRSTTTTVNGTLGVGATAGTGGGDGQILVNAGGTAKPFLEAVSCLGNGSISTATYSIFKGFLAIKIGASVGATAVSTGTHYIRLWSNA